MQSQKPRKRKPRLKVERSRRKSDALHLATRLMVEAGDRLPVDLGPLRKRRGIKSVKFRPLLTDGTLVILNEGFQILIQCSDEMQDSLSALFELDETGSLLPADLVRQSRFTIAHE